MAQAYPKGYWEMEVLPYPPGLAGDAVTLTLRVVARTTDIVFKTPCQGITADGTILHIVLLDSMFISGGYDLYAPGTFEAILGGISTADAAKLVRIVHYPDERG